MSQRSFVFCDICNPQGYRCVEQRRPSHRDGRDGRRISDGRAWHEGDLAAVLAEGWTSTREGRHICPNCMEHHPTLADNSATDPSIEETHP